MEGTKLEISGGKKSGDNYPTATYKAIPEQDMEEETATRPKSLVKVKSSSPENDGADEKMLPKEDTKVNPNSNVDTVDVKISPNEKQNGDAVLDIGDLKSAFVGLTKEELMKYANDPFWVRLRMFLFVTFWVLWAAMLVGAVLIIYAAPKCDPPPPKNWWEKGPLSEVPADTTIENLKKAVEKGFEGFILPWTEDTYAELDDNHQIVKHLLDAKKEGVKIILELDPSTSGVWFEKSEAKDPSVSDYYIWKQPIGAKEPPNNWKQVNKNETAWVYSSKRREFYYAPFGQPLLNFRNPNVTENFIKVLKGFLNKGASGVSLKRVANLLVDPKFENEDITSAPSSVPYGMTDYKFYTHSKTAYLADLGPLVYQWRKIVKNVTENGPLMIKEELHNVDAFKVSSSLVVDLPVKSRVLSKPVLDIPEIVNTLNYSLNVDGVDWPLWKVNTTAVPRDVVDIVTFLLPGAPLIPIDDKINEALVKIRQSPSIMRGTCGYHSVGNNTVLAFIRVISGNPGILVALNPTNERVTVDFPQEIPALKQVNEVTIQLYSSNYNETGFMDINAKTEANAIPLSPKSALVVSYVPPKMD